MRELSFLGASFQDKFSEDQTYDQDFAVMDYLAGWASTCMGDTVSAKDHLRRAVMINPSLEALTSKHHPYLVIMETGFAPYKMRSGKYNEILKFIDRSKNNTYPHLFVNDTEVGVPVLAGDLLYQATTRGGRQIDSINAGKANFKATAETVAQVGTGVAMAGTLAGIAGNSYGGYMGSAGLAINLISSGVAAATTPEADARTWEGLPKHIYLIGLDAPPADPGSLTMKTDIEAMPTGFPLQSQKGECGFLWAHAPSSLNLAPVTQLIPADTDDDRGPKNVVFRNQLKTQF